jgi:SAM-dependent methyltransferase
MEDLQETVRARYAQAAVRMHESGTGCCDTGCCGTGGCGAGPAALAIADYAVAELAEIKAGADQSLGCGNPVTAARLRPGETVLDLGSGAGLDVLLAARRVGLQGHVYGLDMTDEMLALAHDNQARADVANATFLKGTMEAIPLPDSSVDVVISNCVINLAPDKGAVLREAFRVLRPGGRLAMADVVEMEPLAAELKASLDAWAGCVAGTISVDHYRGLLEAAGFTDSQIEVARAFSLADAGLPGPGAIASAYVTARKVG